MIIRNATLEDIEKVSILEKQIEKDNAATYKTLILRFKMFPKGFYVAEENGEIIGYVESCLWDKESFQTFKEVKDFPRQHNANGKTLYIIFLAVGEKHRMKGTGSELIKTLQKYAEFHNLNKVQLVAGDGFLVDFYKKLGFRIIKKLPDFLPYSPGTLMEYGAQ